MRQHFQNIFFNVRKCVWICLAYSVSYIILRRCLRQYKLTNSSVPCNLRESLIRKYSYRDICQSLLIHDERDDANSDSRQS